MTTTLFIGRFQPFHRGHLHDVEQALTFSDKVIIGVGSSQESGTEQNPYSYEEREGVIKAALADTRDVHIIPIPDIGDDEKWVDHVKECVGDFDLVYSGNQNVLDLFRKQGIKTRRVTLIEGIDATRIRKMMKKGGDWERLVPEEVAEWIEKN